jgi:transcriptional regulator with XRE-family HTH domain
MPAAAASSGVVGGLSMGVCSHITNNYAIGLVRNPRADMARPFSYNPNMAKRTAKQQGAPWYLVEWMAKIPAYTGWGAHTRFRNETGWSKATMSQLYNGEQPYNPVILEEAARALHIEAYELLMHPETAMAYRQMRRGAFTIVETDPPAEKVDSPSTGTHG